MSGVGGDLLMSAGNSTANFVGGQVVLNGGYGYSGAGGAVNISGGGSLLSAGGELSLTGGSTNGLANGGNLQLLSGYSSILDSGDIRIQTANGGLRGSSGNSIYT